MADWKRDDNYSPAPRRRSRPKNPELWEAEDVRDWLAEDDDWERYADDFVVESIDGKRLERLTPQSLADLGVKKNHRPQLIQSIRGLFSTLGRRDYNTASNTSQSSSLADEDFPCEYKVLASKGVRVRESRDKESTSIGKIARGERITVVDRVGGRLKISEPVRGWISLTNSSGRNIVSRIDRERRDSDDMTIQELANRRRMRSRSPRRSRSPARNRSRSPARTRSRSPARNRSRSPRSRSPRRSRSKSRSPRETAGGGTWATKLSKYSRSMRDMRDDRRGEYRDREVTDLRDQLEKYKQGSSADREVLLAKSNIDENELKTLTSKLELTSDQVKALRDEIYEKDEEMDNLRKELKSSGTRDEDIDAIRAELRMVQRERDGLISQHEDMKQDLSKMKDNLVGVTKQFEEYRRRTRIANDEYRNTDEFDEECQILPRGRPRRRSNDSEEPRSKSAFPDDGRESGGRDRRGGRREFWRSQSEPRRRLSSDEFESERMGIHKKTPGGISLVRGPEFHYRTPQSPVGSDDDLYSTPYKARGRADDNYVETGVDEDYDTRDRFDTPTHKMRSSSDNDFDEDWQSSKGRTNSPAYSRLSESRSRFDDDEDMNNDERRAARRGKEDFGWFVRYDSKGKPYYYNSVTKSKRTDKPGTLDAMGSVKIHDPVILCEYDGIWYKAQLIEPHRAEYWWVRFDCGTVSRASIHREHIRKWVAWLEQDI